MWFLLCNHAKNNTNIKAIVQEVSVAINANEFYCLQSLIDAIQNKICNFSTLFIVVMNSGAQSTSGVTPPSTVFR